MVQFLRGEARSEKHYFSGYNDIAHKRRGCRLRNKLKTTAKNTSKRERSKKQRPRPFKGASKKTEERLAVGAKFLKSN
jgi:hypothetical protein